MTNFRTIDPLRKRTPIVDSGGNPTDFFVRQWNTQLAFSGDTTNELTTVDGAVTTLLSRNISGTAGRIIGGGELSTGDLAFDLADTNVTPGSYTNSNITVDRFGRITQADSGTGGGSATFPAFNPPLLTQFNIPVGNMTVNTIQDATQGLVIQTNDTASSTRFAGIVFPESAPATGFIDYIAEIAFTPPLETTAMSVGMVFRNSVSTSRFMVGFSNDNRNPLPGLTSHSSDAGGRTRLQGQPQGQYRAVFRARVTPNSITPAISRDGIYFSSGTPQPFNTSFDQVGFGIFRTGNNNQITAYFPHYTRIVSP